MWTLHLSFTRRCVIRKFEGVIKGCKIGCNRVEYHDRLCFFKLHHAKQTPNMDGAYETRVKRLSFKNIGEGQSQHHFSSQTTNRALWLNTNLWLGTCKRCLTKAGIALQPQLTQNIHLHPSSCTSLVHLHHLLSSIPTTLSAPTIHHFPPPYLSINSLIFPNDNWAAPKSWSTFATFSLVSNWAKKGAANTNRTFSVSQIGW